MIAKASFFYRLFKQRPDSEPPVFIGTAFAVAPNGGLLTCRHVIDQQLEPEESIAVFDEQLGRFTTIESVSYPPSSTVDAAFLPEALQREKDEYLPLLRPDLLKVGEEVYAFGYFRSAGRDEEGYFSGRIVNFTRSNGLHSLTLPFPVIEGLSGSPVLTYHHGPKVVGMAYGSRSSRILASEVVEVDRADGHYKETINRIVEFGLAYHVATLIDVIAQLGVEGTIVSGDRVSLPGLE